MKAANPTTNTHLQTGRRLETTSIQLHDGWRGRFTALCVGVPVDHGLPSAADWQEILRAFIAAPFSLRDCATLKFIPGEEVLRGTIAFGGETLTVIAKHHTAEGVGGHISVLLGGSRARRNFERAASLVCSDIATALPLAMIESTRPTRESWLISTYTHGVIDLDRIVLTVLPQVAGRELACVKHGLIRAIAALFVSLARGGWHHRDLKASNILMRHHHSSGAPAQPMIVDLDGLSRARATDTKREKQRLVRLAASLIGYVSVTRTDLARFLRAYLAATDRADDWRVMFRQVALAAVRYADQSERRRADKVEGYSRD